VAVHRKSVWYEPSRFASADVQESVQDANPEAQAVHRHALVDTVEHPGKVQFWRQLKRAEPEAPDSDLAEPFRVGSGGRAVGNHRGLRILGEQGSGHRIVQVAIRRGFQRYVVMNELTLDRSTEQPVDLREEFFLVSRKVPAVYFRGR